MDQQDALPSASTRSERHDDMEKHTFLEEEHNPQLAALPLAQNQDQNLPLPLLPMVKL